MKTRFPLCLFLVLFITVLTLTAASAQQTDTTKFIGWKKSLIADFTVTEASYSDSWTGGEAGSVNWVSNLNGSAEKQVQPWLNFKSTLRLSFGQTMTQEKYEVQVRDTTDHVDSLRSEIRKRWTRPQKSTDLIDWENVGRITKGWVVDPYAAFRLESQFLDATNAAKKLYFTPVKLTESAGAARKFYEKDKSFVTSRLGLALRQILKRTADTALTVWDTTLTDGGLESVTDAELHFNERLVYIGKLSLFKAFFFSQKDDFKGTSAEDYWKAIDVNWENTVNAFLTKVITVRLYTQLLYDKQISLKGRFKETLGIGFVFKLA